MANNSSIEWTQATWNPITGCTRASTGCDNCYAVTMTRRLEAMGQAGKYGGLVNPGKQHFNGVVRLHPEELAEPLRRRKPTKYFVCSMSDLFHPSVPDSFIDQVFATMALCPQHTFQVLTKRADRMEQYMRGRDWGDAANAVHDQHIRPLEQPLHLAGEIVPPLPNVWIMTSAENQEQLDKRLPHLLRTPAAVRGLSLEPLLDPISLPLMGTLPATETGGAYVQVHQRLHWVIVGGESGPKARPMHPVWVRGLQRQCQAAGVPFFFKQWGAWGTKFSLMTTQEPVFRFFSSFQHWVNKASKDFIGGGICLDLGGNQLRIGGDFMAARDGGRFPVAILHRLGKKEAGRQLDGRTYDEQPATIQSVTT